VRADMCVRACMCVRAFICSVGVRAGSRVYLIVRLSTQSYADEQGSPWQILHTIDNTHASMHYCSCQFKKRFHPCATEEEKAILLVSTQKMRANPHYNQQPLPLQIRKCKQYFDACTEQCLLVWALNHKRQTC
jgi:hypothetical protein